jgi:5'-nucleotidase
MPLLLGDKLVVGVASRALFALEAEHRVFVEDGLDAYRSYQRKHEDEPLAPGTAFPLIRSLLAINEKTQKHLVEVIVTSQNDADTGLRVMHSARHYGLDITRAAFVAGDDPAPYVAALQSNLFLSADPDAVAAVLAGGLPAGLVLEPPLEHRDSEPATVRIAFDGDAVLFDDESERFYQTHTIEEFWDREAALADVPMSPGPFEPFLRALASVQAHSTESEPLIRTALVTARNAPAHERVVKTFRHWGVQTDVSVFLGGVEKGPTVAAFDPHIFFDDQAQHLVSTQLSTPSAQVPPPPLH